MHLEIGFPGARHGYEWRPHNVSHLHLHLQWSNPMDYSVSALLCCDRCSARGSKCVPVVVTARC
jgi:hypothetical protein